MLTELPLFRPLQDINTARLVVGRAWLGPTPEQVSHGRDLVLGPVGLNKKIFGT